ncbi:MAG: hypothetical protein MI923_25445 [Phycisphaerales bacterium]|nr:hypothetical protein [Phycisphaerales bacterium]
MTKSRERGASNPEQRPAAHREIALRKPRSGVPDRGFDDALFSTPNVCFTLCLKDADRDAHDSTAP